MDRPWLDVVAAITALALAGVFAVAAASKLRDRHTTAEDFASLGLPRPDRWATIVPIMELGVAVALVVAPGWGGVAAFTLLAAFTANLALVLRSGRVAHCACFGGSSTKPVSRSHLIRNAVLLLTALVAASFDGWIWAAG